MAQKITSVAEYIYKVRDLCARWKSFTTTTTPWFRGQGKSTWRLLPTLYRCDIDPYFERELVRDFQLRSTAYLTRIPENYVAWLFVMQHYGLPTRLLDWTESSLAALYFAIYNYDDTSDAAIWVLNPWTLNTWNIPDFLSVPTLDHKILEKYKLVISDPGNRTPTSKLPLAIRPLRADPRIIAQKGVFTIHGLERTSLEEYADQSKSSANTIKLEKFVIEGEKKFEMLRELYVTGVTHSVLFPDLEALSREIGLRYRRDFMC